MTKSRLSMKFLLSTPMLKQLLATSLLVMAALLISLLIGMLEPRSSQMIEASKDYETQRFAPASTESMSHMIDPISVVQTGGKVATGFPATLDMAKGFILSDLGKRLPKEFLVPEVLRKQTALWFDLFTKYSGNTWLIIAGGRNPAIIEEWDEEKIMASSFEQAIRSQGSEFLHSRLAELSRLQARPLYLQRGLRDDFLANRRQQLRWLPTIEKILKAQRLPSELAKFFLIPKNPSLEENRQPWETLKAGYGKKYLIIGENIDETRSPLKVARVVATLLKKRPLYIGQWDRYFNNVPALPARFYAALYADTYLDELQIEEQKAPPVADMHAFKLGRTVSVDELIRQLRVDVASFYESNPDLLEKPEKTFLPKGFVFFTNTSAPPP